VRRSVLPVLLVVALLIPAKSGAQTLPLTESQALARVSEESPRVQAVRATVDVARADVLAAGRWPNPRVSFNREAVAAVTEHMLTVAQILPLTGRIRLDVRAASARVDAASSRADDQVRRLRADARLAFTDLWAAQARERELARSVARLRDLADVLGRREAGGEAAGFDRLRADREVIEVEADRSLAAADAAQAQGALVGLFAVPPTAPIVEAVRTPQPPAAIPSLDELVARAETARPALIALQHDLEAADLAGRAAARRRLPEPEVVAGTKSSNAGAGDLGSIVAVHIGVPLFDRGRPERALAEARAAQVRAEAATLRLSLRAQIAAWRAAVVERRAIADRYRAAVAAGADEIERIALVSYEAGERGILELLDAYRTASAARARQATLDAAARGAEIELEFVSGWEFP
jgi:cobalt-zinc-cadmium efflux system outer membrane protein